MASSLPRVPIADFALIALASLSDDVRVVVYDPNEPDDEEREKAAKISDLRTVLVQSVVPFPIGSNPGTDGTLNVDAANGAGVGVTWKNGAVVGELSALTASGGSVIVGSRSATALGLAYHDAIVLHMTDTEFKPVTGGVTLGTAANPWADVRTGTLTATGAVSNGGMTFGGAILPSTDGVYDLGAVATRVRDGWFSRNVAIGGNLTVTGSLALSGAVSFGATTVTTLHGTAAATFDGGVTAATFSGDGSALVALAAGALATGTVPTARMSGVYGGVTGLGTQAADLLFVDGTYDIGKSGATRPRDGFFSRTLSALSFIGNGALITALAASALTGTIADAQFPATLPAVSGVNLTNLNAAALTSGVVPNARLSGAYTGVAGLGTLAADVLFVDGLYDIGKTGATRPRDIFASRNVNGSFVGDGSALTALNATNLASGTLPNARFPAVLPAISGVNLTLLNASNIGSGTVPNAALPAVLPALDGSALTGLNASALAGGTVPDARFPAVLPAISGVNLTNLSATALTGTIASARMAGAYTGITSVGTLSGLTLGGALTWSVDGSFDVGSAGASRPRDLFVQRNGLFGGTLGVTGTTTLGTLVGTSGTFSGAGAFGSLGITGVATIGTLNATNATITGSVSLGSVIVTSLQVGSMDNDLFFGTDNTWDIGPSASGRPRDVNVARNATIAGVLSGGSLIVETNLVGFGALTVSGGATAASLTTTGKVTGTGVGGITVRGNAGAGDARLQMVNGVGGVAHLNWEIAKSVFVANALSFTPSTATDGFTFTTPALSLTSAGLLTASAGITANGALLSGVDATYDIGASGALRFRDFYLSRNASIGGVVTVSGTLGVTGAATFSGAVTATSTLSVTGITTFTNAVQLPGNGATGLQARNAANSAYVDLLFMNASDFAVIPRTLVTTTFLANADATYDIGLTGGNRFRDLFLARNAVISGALTAATGAFSSGHIVVTGGINPYIDLDDGSGAGFIQIVLGDINLSPRAGKAVTVTGNLVLAGGLLGGSDATYDIGASGANRFRDLFISRNASIPGVATVLGGMTLQGGLFLNVGGGGGGGSIYRTAANGTVLFGNLGSSTDLLVANGAGGTVFDIPTGTQVLRLTGPLYSANDATQDIGASGVNRFRHLYMSGNATLGGTLTVQGSTAQVNGTTAATVALNTTTGAVSDSSYFTLMRGGVFKWRIGNNVTGTNVDLFEIYNEGGGSALTISKSTNQVGLAGALNIAGVLTANTDNAYDIGLSGSQRFRDLFLTRNATIPGLAQINGGLQLGGPATAVLGPTAAGLFSFENPNMRYYVGDGTGYKFKFSKRVGSTTTDLINVDDVGEIEMLASGARLLMHSPNASRWAVTVSNAGALVVTAA
jgi:hypothetical protein